MSDPRTQLLSAARVLVLALKENHDAAVNARRSMDAATTPRDARVAVACFSCDRMLGLVYDAGDGRLFYDGRDELTPLDDTTPLPDRVVEDRMRRTPDEYVWDDAMLEAALRVALRTPVKHPERRPKLTVRAMLHPATPAGYMRQLWAPCPDHRDLRESWELDIDLLVRSAEQARQLGHRVRYEWPFSPPTRRWREQHPSTTTPESWAEFLRGLIDYGEAHPGEVERMRRREPRKR